MGGAEKGARGRYCTLDKICTHRYKMETFIYGVLGCCGPSSSLDELPSSARCLLAKEKVLHIMIHIRACITQQN